ncbi:MAG TPA: HEAT repeat domain-containing protein, partial [Acidimicrobiales bacterium]|nr:HEAT repeat domain-containing protein [Acidimicrobiales bacterium]
YKKAGLPDKALAVYQQLVEKVGDHTELIESVAEMQRHLGDKAEAVKLYARLLERAMQARNDPLSLDYCRTILKLDPRHAEALALRQKLESGEVEKARQRKRLVRSLVGGAVILAFAVAAAVYEYRARDTYALTRGPITDAVETRNYREVLRLYDSVVDRYRYSLKARELRPDRDDYETRFVNAELARVGDLEKKGQLPEAIAALEDARTLIRTRELSGSTIERLADLRRKRLEAEAEWTAKLARKDPREIAGITDPLAVPALVGLLRPEKAPLVRQAAVTALGSIESEGSVTGLILALRDPEAAISQEAAAHLVKKGRSPLQAKLLGPVDPVREGVGLPVEWRVTNLSPADVELVLEEAPASRLRMTGPAAVPPLPYPTAGSRRVLRLGPGEHVGGTFADLTLRMPVAGRYTVNWAAAVSWNGKSVSLPASPIFIDRR